MRVMLVCLALAGCSPAVNQPAPPKIIYLHDDCPTPDPIIMQPEIVAAKQRTATVSHKEQALVEEAGRYAVAPQSKPEVISELGTLTANASAAMEQLRAARTIGERAAALPAAEAAVNALSNYLQIKGNE